jgi:hypothetical protein
MLICKKAKYYDYNILTALYVYLYIYMFLGSIKENVKKTNKLFLLFLFDQMKIKNDLKLYIYIKNK